jgi:2-aminoethylphosphonate-pyruvate transaminase
MRRVVGAAGDCLRDMGVEGAAPPARALEERAKLTA